MQKLVLERLERALEEEEEEEQEQEQEEVGSEEHELQLIDRIFLLNPNTKALLNPANLIATMFSIKEFLLSESLATMFS